MSTSSINLGIYSQQEWQSQEFSAYRDALKNGARRRINGDLEICKITLADSYAVFQELNDKLAQTTQQDERNALNAELYNMACRVNSHQCAVTAHTYEVAEIDHIIEGPVDYLEFSPQHREILMQFFAEKGAQNPILARLPDLLVTEKETGTKKHWHGSVSVVKAPNLQLISMPNGRIRAILNPSQARALREPGVL